MPLQVSSWDMLLRAGFMFPGVWEARPAIGFAEGTGWVCGPRLCSQVLATMLGPSDLCVPSDSLRCIGNSSGHKRRRAIL